MITIQILEDDDVITKDCYSRSLNFLKEFEDSDYIPMTNIYGGGPLNRLTWTPVKRSHPAWINRTVKELKNFSSDYSRTNTIFCKGNLPNYLITPLTLSEFEHTLYKKYLSNLYIPWVKKFKLKGLSVLQIMQRDSNYFEWLIRSTDEIDSLDYSYYKYLELYNTPDK